MTDDERSERIATILEGDGLSFGARMDAKGTRIVMESSGGKAEMMIEAAELVLGAVEKDWGADCPEAVGLRFLTREHVPQEAVREGTQGPDSP